MNKLLAFLAALSVAATAARAQELPRRAFLGVGLRGLNDSIQQRHRLPSQRGILVTSVRDQSSARAAGLLADDVVLQVDQTEVRDVPQFVGLLKQYQTGDKPVLTLRRGSKTIRKKVELKPFPKESSPFYTAEYGSVSAGQNQLRTIVTRPVGRPAGPLPMVLFVQGVGCFSVDNPLTPGEVTNRIIDSLSRHGYATMRVDKTGMGDSRGVPCAEATFQMEAAGYKAGLAAIRQLPWVDQNNILLTGFSIGGIMAPLAAEGVPVKGIVTWGTATRSFIEYLLHNKRNQSELSGMPYDQLDARMKLYAAALHALLIEKQPLEQVHARFPAVQDWLHFPQHYTYMQQWQDANLPAAWQQLNTNVLVLRGAADYVSYNEDQQLIADVVNRAHPGKATFRVLPDVDHGFNRARTMRESLQLADAPNPEKNFAFMTVILRWLDEMQRQKA